MNNIHNILKVASLYRVTSLEYLYFQFIAGMNPGGCPSLVTTTFLRILQKSQKICYYHYICSYISTIYGIKYNSMQFTHACLINLQLPSREILKNISQLISSGKKIIQLMQSIEEMILNVYSILLKSHLCSTSRINHHNFSIFRLIQNAINLTHFPNQQ